MENKELLPEMLAKAAKAMRADAGYEGNGGLLDDCDYYARQAETALLAAGVPGLIAEVAALTEVLRETQRIAAKAQRERDEAGARRWFPL